MARENIVVGIDVGSTTVRTVIGVVSQESKASVPNIIGVGIAPSRGIRRGVVIDVEETIDSITKAVEEAERMAGEAVDHAVISVSSTGIMSENNRGYISVAKNDGEITVSDTERVLDAAQAVPLPPNRRILKVIPRSYMVDDQVGIKDPLGMTGIRLEVDAHILTGSVPALKNLTKCIHQTGVDIDDYIPAMLASAEAVLTKRQKELGCAIIDIGGGCVTLAVYEEGNLLHTTVLPVGASHITNDVAIGLRTSIDTAEKIKIEYGNCLPKEVKTNDAIDLSSISNIDTQVISKQQLSMIIEARLQEIFALVREELKKIGRDGMLPAGVILTGGGIKTPGIVDLAKDCLNLPVQIGFPLELEGLVDRIDDPAYATAIGLLFYGMRDKSSHYSISKINIFKGTKEWIRSFFP